MKPDDRVLVMPIREHAWIADALSRLTHGVLVGIGDDESVRAARRAFANADNAMFVVEDETGNIPWRDAFFTVVYCREETPELRRVVTPGGALIVG